MSRTYDALKRAEAVRRRTHAQWEQPSRPVRVVTVANNKGGIGKTTIATNLAVYARALREDQPILVFSLDDQSPVDALFELGTRPRVEPATSALRRGSLDRAICLGQYGIHYVPCARDISYLKREIDDPFLLQRVLLHTSWEGLVILDTKSDLEILTQNALAASDLVVVPVSDLPSLRESERVFELLDDWGMPRDRARVLLSMIDLRIKYRDGERGDVLALLIEEIRRRDMPLFESFISRSPKVESLATNPDGRVLSVLHGASTSIVSQQMQHLANDVLKVLSPIEAAREETVAVLRGLTPEASMALSDGAVRVRRFPFSIGRWDSEVPNDLPIPDLPPWQVSRRHIELVEAGGRIGVRDLGSRLGTLVDGKHIGGREDDVGPVFLDGRRGELVLGTESSPYVFEVEIERAYPETHARPRDPYDGVLTSTSPSS